MQTRGLEKLERDGTRKVGLEDGDVTKAVTKVTQVAELELDLIHAALCIPAEG